MISQKSFAKRESIYFHDGSAADLHEVVEFYNTRFNIGLTESEKDDLIAFLAAL